MVEKVSLSLVEFFSVLSALVFYCYAGVKNVYLHVACLVFLVFMLIYFLLRKKIRSFFFLLICLVFSFFCVVNCLSKRKSVQSLVSDEEVIEIEGIISSNPVRTSSKNSYIANIDVSSMKSFQCTSSAKGSIKVLFPSDMIEKFHPGKLFSRSSSLSNELCDQGLYVNLKVSCLDKSFFMVKEIRSCHWKNIFCKIRAEARLYLRRFSSSWKDAGGLFLALFTGIKEYAGVSLMNNFRAAGLSHILALSGMHLSIISGFTLFLLMPLLGKKKSSLLCLIISLGFVLLAGRSPSLTRAFISSSLILFFNYYRVKTFPLPLFSFTFILHILFFPGDALEVSFLLSYGALLGILVFSKDIEKLFISFIPDCMASLLAASVSALVFTVPISVMFFSSFSFTGIISSVIVSPLVTVFLISGIIFMFLSFIFPFLLMPFGVIMGIVYKVIERTVSFFAGFPCVEVKNFSVFYISYFLILMSFLFFVKKKRSFTFYEIT